MVARLVPLNLRASFSNISVLVSGNEPLQLPWCANSNLGRRTGISGDALITFVNGRNVRSGLLHDTHCFRPRRPSTLCIQILLRSPALPAAGAWCEMLSSLKGARVICDPETRPRTRQDRHPVRGVNAPGT